MQRISSRILHHKGKGETMDHAIKTIIVILAVFTILTVSVSSAQAPQPLRVDNDTLVSVLPANVVWEKTYGGSADDRALHALPVGDGYLVVGSTKSMAPNATAGWAIKLNGDGEAVWNRTYLEGQGSELRYALNLTDGYLFVGNQFLANGDVNGYVVCTDTQGAPVWKTILGGQKTDKLFSGFATPDGFAVMGTSYSYGNESTGWVVKLDKSGVAVWDKTYANSKDSAFRSGIYAKDGDYIVAGYVNQDGQGNYDFCLYELSTIGEVVWSKTYGSLDSEKAYSMAQALDGYVLVGERQSSETSTDAWVLKTDPAGNTVWDRHIVGLAADSPTYITASRDGAYLVAGYTFSFGKGERDFWLLKMDSQGKVEFSVTHGNAAFQEAYSVTETADNAYVMFGWTDPIDQPSLIGAATYDFYAVKLCVPTSNQGISTTQIIAIIAAITIPITLFSLFKVRAHKKNRKITCTKRFKKNKN